MPVEDSVGALKDLLAEGKILAIGLSEVSADTLRRAHAVCPIAAVQSEYSLWTRNAEIAVLDACAALDVAYVAFSPLARGFFADMNLVSADFVKQDIRRAMPRFQNPHLEINQSLLSDYRSLADIAGCTPGQLALAWLLQKSPKLHVIPGTTSSEHVRENFAAMEVSLNDDVIESLERLVNQETISGPRYKPATQLEIDTEEFETFA